MKYIVTKKQVEEMYKEILGMWRFYKDNKFSLVLYKDKNNKTKWAFVKGDPVNIENIFYKIEDAGGIFEWVILKEIGGRRQYSKKELIDGIQWNINNNYLKEVS